MRMVFGITNLSFAGVGTQFGCEGLNQTSLVSDCGGFVETGSQQRLSQLFEHARTIGVSDAPGYAVTLLGQGGQICLIGRGREGRRSSSHGADGARNEYGVSAGNRRKPGGRTRTEELRRTAPQARSAAATFVALESTEVEGQCVDPLTDPSAFCSDESDAFCEGTRPPEVTECMDGDDLSSVIGPLTERDKQRLIIDTKDRILAAYSDFGDACGRNRHLIEEAAGGGILEILFDIALGVLAPNFKKIIGGIGKKLEQEIVPSLVAALKKLQKQENVAALVEEVTSKAKDGLKTGAKDALKGYGTDKTEVDAFLTYLQDEAKAKYQDLGESLWNETDEKIIATWAAFDAHILKFSDYVAAIKNLVDQYKKTVAKIGAAEEKTRGKEPFDSWWVEQTTAIWVRDETGVLGTRMALVRLKREPRIGFPGDLPDYDDSYDFLEWVQPELQNFARSKALSISGGADLQTVTLKQVGLR